MKKCYKVLKFENGRYLSPGSCNSYLYQEYFLHLTNFPKHEGTGIFVFKDLNDAIEYRNSDFLHCKIFECRCPSLRKSYPLIHSEYSEKDFKEVWNKINLCRQRKMSHQRIKDYLKNNIKKDIIRFKTNMYDTQYLKFVKDITDTLPSYDTNRMFIVT